jgi:hypothetical protein
MLASAPGQVGPRTDDDADRRGNPDRRRRRQPADRETFLDDDAGTQEADARDDALDHASHLAAAVDVGREFVMRRRHEQRRAEAHERIRAQPAARPWKLRSKPIAPPASNAATVLAITSHSFIDRCTPREVAAVHVNDADASRASRSIHVRPPAV